MNNINIVTKTDCAYNKEIILQFISSLDVTKYEYTIAHNPIIPHILNKVFGYNPKFVYYYNNDNCDELIGYMPGVIFNYKFISMPHFSYGGIATRNQDLLFNSSQINESKYEIRSFQKYSDYRYEDKVTSYLNLTIGKEEYFSSLKYNIRRQIRIASENNIIIKRGNKELLNDFLEVYEKNMTRLGSPSQPKIFFETVLNEWENGEAVIFCAYLGNKPISVCFMLSFGDIIENCWAGSLFEYNKLYVPYLIYSEMIKYSFSKGYKIFSFGRSTKDSGSLAFKKHWKPQVIQLYFNFDSPLKQGIKEKKYLINIYKKGTNRKINSLIGKYITKYVY